jgi:NADH-quinone oxidoreductase subunit H
MLTFFTYQIKSLLFIVFGILTFSFYTILERKIIVYMQRRTSPNLVGPFGLLQAIVDDLKLLVKKTIIPQTANIMIFIAGPLITFNLSYLGWSIIPFDKSAVFVNALLSLLYLLSFSALSLYSLIKAGLASNLKYFFWSFILAV